MDKNPVVASFINATKICCKKQISKSVSNIFKSMSSQTENVHKSTKLLPNKTLVLQNADPNIHSLNNTNKKSQPNLLQHISFRHYILKSKLSSIIGFAFKVGNKKYQIVS